MKIIFLRSWKKWNNFEYLYKLKNENKRIINTKSYLHFFIESAFIFNSKFEKIKINIIVDFIFHLIDSNYKDFIIDETINEKIKKILKEKIPK